MLGQKILRLISNLRIASLEQLKKYVYSGYRITFSSADSFSFDTDFARNVIIVGVDNSSSSHKGTLMQIWKSPYIFVSILK